MQREDAGHDLLARRFVVITFVRLDRPGARFEHHPVVRTFVRRIRILVHELHRLPRAVREAQVDAGVVRHRRLERGEGRGDVEGLRRALAALRVARRRIATPALRTLGFVARRRTRTRPAALRRHRRAGDRVQPAAVPVVGPEQAGQRHHQVRGQHPGADDRMQVPEETAALLRPVQPQPGAPVQPLARPAQVQARDAEEDQRQRGCADDLLAHRVGGQPAVDLHGETEKTFAARLAEQFSGVGIDVAGFAAHAAAGAGFGVGGRREADPRAFFRIARQAQRLHLLARLGRGDARQQLRRRQCAGLRRHRHHAGVQCLEQVMFERQHRPGDAHHRQHQAGGDAQQPVQLEDQVLEHGARLRRPTSDAAGCGKRRSAAPARDCPARRR